MSKKASPTAIGLFVVIGVSLGVIALIIFSSGRLFSKQDKFILYFNASLKGLNVGAPVKMRGVTIGSVYEVLIAHNQTTNDFAMPVIIEVDEKLVRAKTDRNINLDSDTFVNQAIRRGLRGKLDTDSLVTGVLYVELEMMPFPPPAVFHQIKQEYTEIPTAPTEIQQLLANLAHLDLSGISEKLNALLGRLDTALSQLNVREINAGVTNILISVDKLINTPQLTNALTEVNYLIADLRSTVARLDHRIDPMADGVTNVLHDAQVTLQDLRHGLNGLSGMVEPDAPFRTDITDALDQLGRAAQAVADLAEFLQRNPNALITGRKSSSSQP